MRRYKFLGFEYLLIWRKGLSKSKTLYFTKKESAVDKARSLIRQGYWVKIKDLREPHKS